jgi:regulator of protease activity HflC (stomatin/prohibitin superfamily)
MASQVISFRFTDQEIELLRQRSLTPDESTNAIAQRLLREIIGASTDLFTTVDTFSERVQSVVDARIETTIYEIVDSRIQSCIQKEMETILGECNA